MLASQGDKVLQNHGTAAMLALVGCDTRPIGPGVYDVNSTDKEGCTVLHRYSFTPLFATFARLALHLAKPLLRDLSPAQSKLQWPASCCVACMCQQSLCAMCPPLRLLQD